MVDLFSPETVARVTRQTSIDAMLSVEERAPNLRTRVWRCLARHGPQTPDEVAARIGESILSVRPQFTLLTKENKIADTGERRTNDSGRKAMVWKAQPPEVWRDAPDHMTAQERIEKLQERVSYLERLLDEKGIPHD